MEIRYDRKEWSRFAAWRHLLKNKPEIELGGHRFTPRNHHFRKDHFHEDSWGWIVAKWVCEDCTEEPAQAPPPYVETFDHTVHYLWCTWTEHDGSESTGFSLPSDF